MALEVEDGTGTNANAEAYVSVSDFEAYHAKMGNALPTATPELKEAAIRKATMYLDGRYYNRWKGYRVTDTQALSWPRECVVIDDVELPASELPVALIRTCSELALLALSGTELFPVLERGGRLRSKTETIGPITERNQWNPSAPTRDTYTIVEDLVRPLIRNSGTTRELVRS